MSIVFTTNRLVIRHPEAKDVVGIYKLMSDPTIIKNNCFPVVSFESVAKSIAEQNANHHRYIMALKTNDTMVGELNLERDSLRYDVPSVMFSYNVLPEYQGQGYMKEALKAAIAHAFTNMKATIVSARVFADNEKSQQLLLHLGFQHEGTLRRAVKCGDIIHDDCVFSLLREDYEELQKRNGHH